MTAFKIGDRVRVRAEARTPYDRRPGTVERISRDYDGAVFSYGVHLDGEATALIPVPFKGDELEPEPSSTP